MQRKQLEYKVLHSNYDDVLKELSFLPIGESLEDGVRTFILPKSSSRVELPEKPQEGSINLKAIYELKYGLGFLCTPIPPGVPKDLRKLLLRIPVELYEVGSGNPVNHEFSHAY